MTAQLDAFAPSASVPSFDKLKNPRSLIFGLPKHVRDGTSSKRSYPDSIHEENGDTPHLHVTSPGRTMESKQPKTPDGRRPPLSKKARSAPECKLGGEATRFDDTPLPIPNLGNRFGAPCGRLYVKRGAHFDKHLQTCKKCIRLIQKVKEGKEVDDEGSASTRKQAMLPEDDPEQKEQALDHDPEQADDTTDNKEDSGSKIHTPDCDRNSSEETRSSTDNLPGSKASSPAYDMLLTEAEANESGLFRTTVRNGTPLDIEDEVNSDESPRSTFDEHPMDLSRFHDNIKEKLRRSLTAADQRGYVYIFFDPARPDLCKIGRAKQTDKRLKQIQYSCGLQLQLVQHRQVDYYTRTEALVHMYLADLCCPYKCDTCGRKHGEWFKITKQTSRTSLHMWATFMDQERPYDAKSKELDPFLHNLIELRGHFFRGSDADTVRFTSADADTARKHWNQILAPTRVDRLSYKFNIIWVMVWRFFWPVNVMIAWTATFIAVRHPAVFVLMAASVVGSFVTVLKHLHGLQCAPVVFKKKAAKQTKAADVSKVRK